MAIGTSNPQQPGTSSGGRSADPDPPIPSTTVPSGGSSGRSSGDNSMTGRPGGDDPGPEAPRTSTTGGGGGGGGGGGSRTVSATGTVSKSAQEIFYDWTGRYPTTAEQRKMADEGWSEDTIRRYARSRGEVGPLMEQAILRVRQIAAPFYDGDPWAVPSSLVWELIADGTYADETYLRDTYFPALRGASLTNPQSAAFVDAWTELTGMSLTQAAMDQLNKFIKSYGYTANAEAAWLQWIKTTDAAITGNFGAEHREAIRADIASILGRDPTATELAANGAYWNLNDAARMEALRQSPEYQAIYAGKPAWMSETEWQDAARAYDSVLQWYYGDRVVLNDDGSLTFPTTQNTTPSVDTASLTARRQELQANIDLYTGPTAVIHNQAAAQQRLDEWRAEIAQIDAQLIQAASQTSLNTFGVTYITPDMLADLIASGFSPEEMQQEFAWTEDATALAGQYGEILTEAFGTSFSDDQWYTLASGAQGSGALRAQLYQAQNRVSYREAFRQAFGYDPDPGDYDRILNEYISPSELLRNVEAQNSAEEMYDEVNELLMRIYGDGVSMDELKDMALGREGTGELKALINQATRLDSFREIHKQYYGAEATPEDYAKYAGYTSAAELQWEIVTSEAVEENRAEIQKAWAAAYPDEPLISDEDLFTMYGEQEGYGELRSQVKEAKRIYEEKEQAEDWAYTGAERADIGYKASEQGGFKLSTPGLSDL